MISVIVPAMNEGDGLHAFYDELMRYLPDLSKEYEVIFIDDGSTDDTLSVMQKIAGKNHHVRVFSFKKNRGKADALAYAFSKVTGDIVVTMDADLQDKPSELHKFLNKYKDGTEVVCGWRKERKDKSKMVVISRFFNWINRKMFGVPLHDIDCGYKMFSQESTQSLHIYGGLYRFIPLILHQQGFEVNEVVVEHDTRKFGKSKYGFSKVWKNLPDLFTVIFLLKFGKRPLHFFGVVGVIFSFIGLIMLGYLTFVHYAFGETVGRRPLLFIGCLFITAGFQTFFTGFIADLILNISHSSRPLSESINHFPIKYSSDSK